MNLLCFSHAEKHLRSLAFSWLESAVVSRSCSARASSNLYTGTSDPLQAESKKRPMKGVAVEADIFEFPVRLKFIENALSEEGKGENDVDVASAEEDKDGESAGASSSLFEDASDAGLIPNEWKPLQTELYKSKAERKRELRLLELENAKRKLMQQQQRRQKIRIIKEMSVDDGIGQASLVNEGEEGGEIAIDGSAQPLAFGPGDFIPDIIFEKREEKSHQEAPLSVKSLLLRKEQNAERRHADKRRQIDSGPDQLFTEDEKQLLNNKSPDLNKTHCIKWPALHVLVSSGQFICLDRFLRFGVCVDSCDEDGYTAFQRAIMGRKETSVTQLVRAGGDVQVLDKDGASLLHHSVQVGSLKLVQLFIKQGLDINLADKAGWTPLHVAVITGSSDLVKLLLANGADKQLKTEDGQTPLDLCLALGGAFNAKTIAKMLKKSSSFDPMEEETPVDHKNGV